MCSSLRIEGHYAGSIGYLRFQEIGLGSILVEILDLYSIQKEPSIYVGGNRYLAGSSTRGAMQDLSGTLTSKSFRWI